MSEHYPPNDGQPLSEDELDQELGNNERREGDDMFGIGQGDEESDAAADRELIQLIDEKDAQIAELNDRFLRLAAELENTRRRADREKNDAGKYAITELARDLVTVADNFDRALRVIPDDTTVIPADAAEGLITGLRMTEKELLSVLQRYNVHRISPAGERFDPNLHQAVAQVPGNGVPVGFVVDVAQPGFTIGDRVLRAAMVTVSLGGEAPANPAPKPASSEGHDPEQAGMTDNDDQAGDDQPTPGSTIDTQA